MGYDVSAFMFYGLPLDVEGYDCLDLSHPKFEIILTGCGATNNPPMQKFVCIRSTYQYLIKDAGAGLFINSISLEHLPSVHVDLEMELIMWLEENKIAPHYQHLGWYVATYGS